jgi:hypothetical protein
MQRDANNMKNTNKIILTITIIPLIGLLVLTMTTHKASAKELCETYYQIPCTDNGELKEDYSDKEIDTFYAMTINKQIHIPQRGVDYLIKIEDRHNNK